MNDLFIFEKSISNSIFDLYSLKYNKILHFYGDSKHNWFKVLC